MTIHKNLAKDGWNKLTLVEQMANIGSEASRTINWKGKNDEDARQAFERFVELINLTMKDTKNKKRLKEVARVRELFTDWYLGNGAFKTSAGDWQNYFLQFAIAARS